MYRRRSPVYSRRSNTNTELLWTPMGPKLKKKTGFDKIIVLIMKEVKSDENKVQKNT